MKGVQYGKSYGSLDDTIITIEADERTPLLVDHKTQWMERRSSDGINNNNYWGAKWNGEMAAPSPLPSMSYAGSSNWSQASGGSTKSFKSHFYELKVLAFAVVLLAGLSIAVYLLIIETRLPSITFSLDLVHHDIWSRKQLPMGLELDPNQVNRIILTQTGSKNCDNSYQCMEILQEMQANSNRLEELPYNFLIGEDGLTYEVRGWYHESGMPGVPQTSSLVIGLIGNFEYSPPPEYVLRTVKFLVQELVKRHKIQPNYRIYGFNKFCENCLDHI